jgi:phosphatidylinositol-4,5-bisphosphate 3-kinase/phosphatidylinositol-4-phosphate 3-kinase
MIKDTDKNKIEEIKKRSPFEEMTNYDKETIWSNRYILSSEPEYLSRLLTCVDYSNPKHLVELEKIIELAKLLNSTNSIGLLGGKFMHESIRNFAVKCLKNSPYIEIQEYLYELIHGLRYEINHDNELARFLLEKAIKYPVTIGHTFYWFLKSQMYEQNFQQRYGLYLEIFLNKIGPTLTKIFYDEDILISKLEEICEEQKSKKLGKKEKQSSFNELINNFNESLNKENNEISLPLNFKYRINKIDLENCKILLKDSKHIQLIINLKNVDPLGDDFLINYYNDQDIRMNLVTMQLFNVLHTIWCENNLRLKMSLYNVMTTSRNKGLIQLIPDSQIFDEMPIKEKAGGKNLFGKRSLRKYLTLNSGISPEEFYDNFISSNVCYCVANYVLGVTQRNKRNLNLKKNGEIYYTQYEHLLNHYSKIYGDRGLPFFFNITFVDFLSEKEEKLKAFKELFEQAYLLLRNKSKDLVELLEILLSSGLPEISQKSLQFLEDTLALNKTEEEAKEILNSALNYIMGK